jgi:hypothetical protein
VNYADTTLISQAPNLVISAGLYYWRIRARDSAASPNYSNWTGTYSLRIYVGAGVPLTIDRGEVKSVVQSPSVPGVISPGKNEKVRFVFKSTELNNVSGGEYNLSIMDVVGNVIYQETKTSGLVQDEFTWTPEKNLPPGVYIGYIEGPGVKYYDTFIIAK